LDLFLQTLQPGRQLCQSLFNGFRAHSSSVAVVASLCNDSNLPVFSRS
jgi:hypothetical protein